MNAGGCLMIGEGRSGSPTIIHQIHMPRFVLLYHDWPSHDERPSHCDLMLEAGGVLRTWSLTLLPRDWAGTTESAVAPEFAATNTVPAEQLADHRLEYLDYEGPVSGDRGSVRRLDAGTFASRHESPDCWEVTLDGRAIRGDVSLQRKSSAETQLQLGYQSSQTVKE